MVMAGNKQKSKWVANKTANKGFGNKPLEQELAIARGLLAKKKFLEARPVIIELAQKHPDNLDVMTELIDVGYQMQDLPTYARGCEGYLKIKYDEDVAFALAGAYAAIGMPLLALEAFRDAIARYPKSKKAKTAAKTVETLEGKIDEFLASGGLSGEEGYKIAIAHERAQTYLQQRNYPQAKIAAKEVIKLKSDFAPAYNNLSLIAFLSENISEAIKISQQVLEFQPDNIHALANLVHYYASQGEFAPAQAFAEKIKTSQAAAADFWSKKAEAFSYVGDDEGIIELYNEYQTNSGDRDEPNGLFFHLVAVAFTRHDRIKEARNLWKTALDSSISQDLAQTNLSDLNRPVGMRHAPWAFPLGQWIQQSTIPVLGQILNQAIASVKDSSTTESESQAIQKFLRDRPEINKLIPTLLHLGDPQGREFAFRLAIAAKTPDTYQALQEFALSKNGPDEMRHRAAIAVSDTGVFGEEPVRLWLGGEWREVALIAYEFYDEPDYKHSRNVTKLLSEAITLMKTREPENFVPAEEKLLAALQLEDTPDLHQNLALVYANTNRQEQALNLYQEIMERFPDYVMARLAFVNHLINTNKLDEAEPILKKLMNRRRFHFHDFAKFSHTYIEFYLAKKEPEPAKSWLQMWENVDPDNPDMKVWKRKLK